MIMVATAHMSVASQGVYHYMNNMVVLLLTMNIT